MVVVKGERIKDKQHNIKVGAIRVIRLTLQYEALGYLVCPIIKSHEGVDMIVISLPDGRIRKVIEVTNWNEKWVMPWDKLRRYITVLTHFQSIEGVEMELVVSYEYNISPQQREELKRSHIRLNVMGKQDLDFNILGSYPEYFEEVKLEEAWQENE